MAETSVLNVDQKNHMTLKVVMAHVAVVTATRFIFLTPFLLQNHTSLETSLNSISQSITNGVLFMDDWVALFWQDHNS